MGSFSFGSLKGSLNGSFSLGSLSLIFGTTLVSSSFVVGTFNLIVVLSGCFNVDEDFSFEIDVSSFETDTSRGFFRILASGSFEDTSTGFRGGLETFFSKDFTTGLSTGFSVEGFSWGVFSKRDLFTEVVDEFVEGVEVEVEVEVDVNEGAGVEVGVEVEEGGKVVEVLGGRSFFLSGAVSGSPRAANARIIIQINNI